MASDEEGRTAQSSLDIALEAAGIGIWQLDSNTGEVTRSGRFDKLLGYTSTETIWDRNKWLQYLVEEDKELFGQALDNMPAQQQLEFEGRVLHQDGTIRWVRIFGKVFYSHNGDQPKAAGVIFDITDQKTLERQKDEFISIASHELKTPVTSIRGYADLLLENLLNSGDLESADLMGKLKKQTDRLTSLIGDLLDVSRIKEGQLRLNKIIFDMNALVVSTVEEIQRTTPRHKLTLDLQPGNLSIQADRDRMRQVLTNLLSNAIKYSPSPGEVIISSSMDERSLQLTIRDHGPGMSPETQKRIFERFYRGQDSVIRSYPGLGLGLYISSEIIRHHGGKINLQSAPGNGSTFTIALPASVPRR